MIPVYDEIAEWYTAFLNDSPVHALTLPAIAALTGEIAGQRVCDLACGSGIVARALARRQARVTGIDISPRLLDYARQEEAQEPLGIVYKLDDAQTLSSVEDEAFDGVVCCLALMDIPDLDATLRAVARILHPGGWFVFAITHPCFMVPDSRWTGQKGGTVKREVRGYFREAFWRSDNPHGVRGRTGAYHRTLTTYLNALTENGLLFERMAEPQPQDEVAGRVPGYYEVPVVLVARCRKSQRPSG